MGLSDIWDGILDELDYLIHFEWISDIGEFFSGFFDNIGEFSFAGLAYGAILTLMVFLMRKYVFTLIHNVVVQIMFYIITFVAGYFLGRRVFEESG